MTNYQGFENFEDMMADRRENFSKIKTPLDLRMEIEYMLERLKFSRTQYTAFYSEWTNSEGFSVRLYSKGQLYEIYLPNKEKHSQGSYQKLIDLLGKRLQKENEPL